MGSSRWGSKELAFEKRGVSQCTPSSVQHVNTNKQLIDRAPKTENENVGFQQVAAAFPRGALTSMFHASILRLILRCGTTAAAVIIIIYTPTVGLGCRSLGHIIYGATAVIIMLLSIISTISARIPETREERSPDVKAFTKLIVITLRGICFLLALINRTGLILLSCLQFINHLDNCYCNASVIGRVTGSYTVLFYNGSVTTMRNSRIGGTILSGVTMGVYMIVLWLTSALPAEVDGL